MQMHFPGTLLAVFKARFIYVCGWSLFVSLTRARAKSKRRWDSESRGPAVGGGVCRQTAAKDLGFLTTTARHFFPAWSYELPVSLQLLLQRQKGPSYWPWRDKTKADKSLTACLCFGKRLKSSVRREAASDVYVLS